MSQRRPLKQGQLKVPYHRERKSQENNICGDVRYSLTEEKPSYPDTVSSSGLGPEVVYRSTLEYDGDLC